MKERKRQWRVILLCDFAQWSKRPIHCKSEVLARKYIADWKRTFTSECFHAYYGRVE